ncbi:MAG TPA: vitamin K epoxide reductase family protein [Candidatus Paceibacterota bacterium]
MTKTTRWTVLALSFLGIADAAYLAQSALSGSPLSCSLANVSTSGCQTVAQSAYAHVFGIPLGVYGVIFYGVVFALAAVSLLIPHVHVARALRILSVFGVLASVAFLFIQLSFIHALCLYCEASGILALLMFIVVWWRPFALRFRR